MRALSWVVLLAACSAGSDAQPDAAPPRPDADLGVDLPAVPPGCTEVRAEEDRPDDHHYDQIRVLYVTASDGPDFAHDTSGRICNSVRSIATWFNAQSGANLRFDTTGGLVDIGFVRLVADDTQMRGSDPGNANVMTGIAFVRERIELELQRAGMLASNKLYAVYYEGTSSWACGGGAWPPVLPGRVGAMYLRATPPGESQPCGDSRPWGRANLVPDYVDYGILHELVHSLGIAPDAAPNEHSTGHVYDVASSTPERDLMYSPRPGMPDRPWNVGHPDGLLLDLGNDDYFRAPTPFDLAGSSLIAPLPANAHRPRGW